MGQWSFRAETGDRPILGSLAFRMEGAELAGAYVAPNGKATRLSNLTSAGGRIAFDIVGPLGTWHLVGAVAADRMAGTFETVTRTVSWTATRAGSPPRSRTPRP